MARPSAKELTERELEVMHVFWNVRQSTAAEIRDRLASAGRDLAYTTVATLIRILSEKGFLKQINDERPFQYRAIRSYEEVSRSILGDLVEQGFSRFPGTVAPAACGGTQAQRQGTDRIGVNPKGGPSAAKEAFLSAKGEKPMNTLGIALVWCVVQVTLIGLLASGLYILLRRMRPAAASPAVLTGLLMVVILSLLALSPWPRWTNHRFYTSAQSAVASANVSSPTADDSAEKLSRISPRPIGRGAGGEGRRPTCGKSI